jgi:hypothetical protein
MTKKKACKKGCVDCNDCLLKHKVKKQRLAKAKALLKPRGSKVSKPTSVLRTSEGVGNFDWVQPLPKMQFIQKKREDKSITLGELQNELRNFRINNPRAEQVVSTIESIDNGIPLRESVREAGLNIGDDSRVIVRTKNDVSDRGLSPPNRQDDEMENLFERPYDRNEERYEDEMDNEDDTVEEPQSLLTRGKNALFSFMRSAVEPEPEGLIPPSFQLPPPEQTLPTIVQEESKEELPEDQRGETKENEIPLQPQVPEVDEDELIDEQEFEDVEFGGGLSNAELDAEIPLPQPDVPVLQAQPDEEDADEFNFGISPEDLASYSQYNSALKK